MANKRISELSSRTPAASDLMLVGDPTTGYSYKCLVSQVGGVQSVFGRTGAVTAQEGDYTLTQLGDVTITSPQLDQVLVYNGGAWVNTENYSNKVQHYVKLGAAIAKGRVVYVSGASGTNMVVNVSSNDSEATSSKVLGVTASGGALNDMVYVITEGLLPNIDTSGSTIGDAVWLGSNGALIFGVANRPVPPLNAVYIGVVTRVSATVGEIFIRVQNGFELEELHNVKFTSLANNQALVYNSTTSLWENRTLTTSIVTEGTNLYYTDTRARGAISLTTTGTGAATYNSSTGVLNIPTPSSVNLYNSDGTLTGNRTVTMGGNTLEFSANTNTERYISMRNLSSGNASIGGFVMYANSTQNVTLGKTSTGFGSFAGVSANDGLFINVGGKLNVLSDGQIQFGTSGVTTTRNMTIFTSGNIGINTTTDAGFRLDVNGTARVQNVMTIGTSTEMKILTQFVTGAVVIGPSNLTGNAIPAGNVIIAESGRYLSLTTGVRNTLIGRNSGGELSTGSENLMIGKNAGRGISTGSNNVILGVSDATNLPAATSNSILIYSNLPGNDGSTLPTNTHAFFGGGFSSATAIRDFYFGQFPFTASAASVPIVFYAPSGLGTDIGGSNFTISAGRGTGTGTPGDVIISTSTATTTGTTLQTLSTRVVIKGETGNVGIGTTSPSYKLHVTGTAQVTGNVLLALSTAYVGIGTIIDTTYKLSVDGSAKFTGIRTAQPTGGVSVADWKFGSTATGTFTLDTGLCLEVEVGGTLYKVGLVS